jgi:surfactin synthase thioesterase subunit
MNNPGEYTLICLPYAGGNRYAYNAFRPVCPGGIRLLTPELPGRGARCSEKACRDLYPLADDVLDQVTDCLPGPYAIYGHSMGALLGYLLTRKIVQSGRPAPLHLFVTGCRAPQAAGTAALTYNLPSGRFLETIRALGGCPEAFFGSQQLVQFYEPILRADVESVETFRYTPGPPLDVPITVGIGRDEKISLAQAHRWAQETEGPFELRTFPGNHFFIFDQASRLLDLIGRKTCTFA